MAHRTEKWRRRDGKALLDLDFLVTLGGYGSQRYFAILLRMKVFDTVPKMMRMTIFEEARGQEVSIARTKRKNIDQPQVHALLEKNRPRSGVVLIYVLKFDRTCKGKNIHHARAEYFYEALGAVGTPYVGVKVYPRRSGSRPGLVFCSTNSCFFEW